MVVSARAYGTTSVANSVENVNNSTMKTYLDNWYQNNLSDVDDKISKMLHSVITVQNQLTIVEHIIMPDMESIQQSMDMKGCIIGHHRENLGLRLLVKQMIRLV